eukprot:5274674-Pyramimonas_sp.AAC.1
MVQSLFIRCWVRRSLVDLLTNRLGLAASPAAAAAAAAPTTAAHFGGRWSVALRLERREAGLPRVEGAHCREHRWRCVPESEGEP